MKIRGWASTILMSVMALLLGMPGTAGACATCFGASDSAMAQGMNLGILSLLGVIGGVLSGVIGFFTFLALRATRLRKSGRPKVDSWVAESAGAKSR